MCRSHFAVPLARGDVEAVSTPSPDDDLLVLDEALNRLVQVDTRAAEVVKLWREGGGAALSN